MAEQQLELIHDTAKAYETMSISALSNILHPDYVHVTRPDSVNVPKQNKAECLEYYRKMFDNWAKVAMPNVKVLANSPGKVVVHITTDVTLKSGSVVPYESFIDYHVGEDPSGDMKIKYAEEFIDANAFADAFAPFMEAKT